MPNLERLSKPQLIARIVELESALFIHDEHDELRHLPIHLSPTCKAILNMLYTAKGRYLTTDYFCDTIGNGREGYQQTVKAHICYLRAGLRQLGVEISSAQGSGYKLPLPEAAKLKEACANSQSQGQGIPDSVRLMRSIRNRSSAALKGTQDERKD